MSKENPNISNNKEKDIDVDKIIAENPDLENKKEGQKKNKEELEKTPIEKQQELIEKAENDTDKLKNEIKNGVAEIKEEGGTEAQVVKAQETATEINEKAEKEKEKLNEELEREQEIRKIAQKNYEKRMAGKNPEEWGETDKMLREKGIEPWTPEAEKFMRELDWQKAVAEVEKEISKNESKAQEKNPTPKEKPIENPPEKREDKERKKIYSDKKIHAVVAKGAIDTLGSLFGVRVGWEVVNLYKASKRKGATSEATFGVFEESLKYIQDKNKNISKEEKKITKDLVKNKINALQSRIESLNLSSAEKQSLQSRLFRTMKEHRDKKENLEQAKTGQLAKALDIYINNSAQKWTVAREVMNTATIFAAVPWMRTIGYTGLAIAERAAKAANAFDKRQFEAKEEPRNKEEREKKEVEKNIHLESKFGFIAKNMTFGAAEEFFRGFTGFADKKKSVLQKTMGAVSSFGSLLRAIGIYSLSAGPVNIGGFNVGGRLTTSEGGQKFFEAVQKGEITEIFKQGAENWVSNSQRILSWIGLSKNPDVHKAEMLANEKKAENIHKHYKEMEEKLEGVDKDQKEMFKEIKKGKDFNSEIKEKFEKIETGIKEVKIEQLSTIQKGEGVRHVLIRQLENNPEGFGFKGDINDAKAVHEWAGKEAYRIAISEKYVDPKTGHEIRVLYDEKNPSQYILKPGKTIEVRNAHEYGWDKPIENKTQPVNKIQFEDKDGWNEPIEDKGGINTDEKLNNLFEIRRISGQWSPEEKYEEIVKNLNSETRERLVSAMKEMGGWVEFKNQTMKELFTYPEGRELGKQLLLLEGFKEDQIPTNAGVYFKGQNLTVEEYLNSIHSSKILPLGIETSVESMESMEPETQVELEKPETSEESKILEPVKKSEEAIEVQEISPQSIKETITTESGAEVIVEINGSETKVLETGVMSGIDLAKAEKFFLKDNWESEIKIPKSENPAAAKRIITSGIRSLFIKNQALEKLMEKGEGNGQIAEAIKTTMKSIIKSLEGKYGKIFK